MLNGNLPGRFSYFSFTNLKGIATTGSTRFDRSEQNLRIRIVDGMPFDVNLQALFIDGDGNDFYQAGLGWRFWKDFHLVAEYRRNDFRVGDEHNLAVGLEFKARW